jgi:cysteinyl-tRNA synthetase
LRIRPVDAKLLETEVESRLEARRMARANKNYAEADRLRHDLNRNGVVIMDGDPLAWEWHAEE